MLGVAIGFSSVCLLLGCSFYRKFRARMSGESVTGRYARIGDWQGRAIPLAFEYLADDGDGWRAVQVEVDEIYHYGRDYFLKGFHGNDGRSRIFKWSRVGNLRIRSTGRCLESVDELIVEADPRGGQAPVMARYAAA